LQSEGVRDIRAPLLALFAGVGMLLAIACVNIASLLIARAAARAKETALRIALGASRARLLREGVAEVLVVSVAGGACGCLIAYGLTASLQLLPPHVLPRLRDIRVDGVVLAFALGTSVISGLAIGLLSAWRASRSTGVDDLHQHALRGSTHSAPARLRPSNLLVVAEIAAAVVLLTGAGLLVRSFVKLINVDLGYNARGLVTFKVGLPAARYPTEQARRDFYDRFAGEIRRIPRAVSVAGADESLSGSAVNFYPLSVDGRDVGEAEVRNRGVSADYFRTIGVPILEGRELAREDRSPTPTPTVVNEAFVRRYLAGRSPIGRQIRYSSWNVQVVGVAANTRNTREDDVEPTMYLPATHGGFFREVVMYVRTTGDPADVLAATRPLLARLDPQLAAYDSASVEEMLEYSSASPRLYSLVSFACAVVALMLAVIGLYGVLAYSVGARTQEFGIRMALGAESRTVMWQVMRQGLLLTTIGLTAGLGGSYAAARGLSTLLFGITPADVPTFATTGALLTATAVLACLIPSRRATRVDPVIALRSE
jgi:putative ABC transport system permease protein